MWHSEDLAIANYDFGTPVQNGLYQRWNATSVVLVVRVSVDNYVGAALKARIDSCQKCS